MTMQDPFESGQREALQETDALLDRMGARAPFPEDLDDPVVASLALMAAQVDVDAVPIERTRAAVEQAMPEVWADDRGPAVPEADLLVLAGSGWSREELWSRGPRGPRRGGRHPEHAAVAMAPPRSLPPPGWPGEPRRPERRLRPLTAVVVAVAAIILGIGVSAAVTGGRSINPVTGLEQVVAQLTNGRTAEQQELYDANEQRIDAATGYVRDGKWADAVHQLNRINTGPLPSEDADHIAAQVRELLKQLHRT
jgi:hypothetical protein